MRYSWKRMAKMPERDEEHLALDALAQVRRDVVRGRLDIALAPQVIIGSGREGDSP